MTRRRLILLAGLAFGNMGADEPAPKKTGTEVPPLNARIVAYCKSQLGKKVKNGECTSLATESLKEAGAKRFPSVGDGDYVWGRSIESFRDALPGDILQFRDAVFKGKRALSKYRTLSWVENYPHHTAIVSEVKERGKFVKILHQNYGPDESSAAEKMVVQEATLHPDALQPGGKVWIYRPVAPDEP